MKLSIFADLWHKKHPGTLVQKNREGKLEMTFKPDGKVYAYTGTIQGLAESFRLIPEIDFNVEAERVVSLLEKTDDSAWMVWALHGSIDTVRELWYKRHGGYYEVFYTETNIIPDKYGRIMHTFFLTSYDNDPWVPMPC